MFYLIAGLPTHQYFVKSCSLTLHTIAMVKAMPKVYYTFNGKTKNLKTFMHLLKRDVEKLKFKSSVVVGIGIDCNGQEILAKIVFVRDRNRSTQMACTNIH